MARKTITAAVVSLVAFAGWWWLAPRAEESASTRHLVNRLWVERMPQDSRDVFGKFLLLDTPDGRFGVVGRSSTWVHRYEVFLWRLSGDTLRARFPQHGVRDEAAVRTWVCEDEAPEPFELCLEVRSGGRRVRLYSMRSWEVRPGLAADSVSPQVAAWIEPLVRSGAGVSTDGAEPDPMEAAGTLPARLGGAQPLGEALVRPKVPQP